MRGRIALTKRFPHTGGQRENACRARTSFRETHSRRVKRPSLRPAARNQLSTLNSQLSALSSQLASPTAVTAEDAEWDEALVLPWAEL